MLRPGNAGSNTAADHIAVLDAALAQLPEATRAGRILVRTDGAGFSHSFIDHLTAQGLEYSLGYAVTETSAQRYQCCPNGSGASLTTATAAAAKEHRSPN